MTILTLDYSFDSLTRTKNLPGFGLDSRFTRKAKMSIGTSPRRSSSSSSSASGQVKVVTKVVSAAQGGQGGAVKRPGKRPGRKPSKVDEHAKLERSRQSARECRARKKLRYQYLEELLLHRERAVLALREELQTLSNWCLQMDEAQIVPEQLLKTILQEDQRTQRQHNHQDGHSTQRQLQRHQQQQQQQQQQHQQPPQQPSSLQEDTSGRVGRWLMASSSSSSSSAPDSPPQQLSLRQQHQIQQQQHWRQQQKLRETSPMEGHQGTSQHQPIGPSSHHQLQQQMPLSVDTSAEGLRGGTPGAPPPPHPPRRPAIVKQASEDSVFGHQSTDSVFGHSPSPSVTNPNSPFPQQQSPQGGPRSLEEVLHQGRIPAAGTSHPRQRSMSNPLHPRRASPPHLPHPLTYDVTSPPMTSPSLTSPDMTSLEITSPDMTSPVHTLGLFSLSNIQSSSMPTMQLPLSLQQPQAQSSIATTDHVIPAKQLFRSSQNSPLPDHAPFQPLRHPSPRPLTLPGSAHRLPSHRPTPAPYDAHAKLRRHAHSYNSALTPNTPSPYSLPDTSPRPLTPLSHSPRPSPHPLTPISSISHSPRSLTPLSHSPRPSPRPLTPLSHASPRSFRTITTPTSSAAPSPAPLLPHVAPSHAPLMSLNTFLDLDIDDVTDITADDTADDDVSLPNFLFSGQSILSARNHQYAGSAAFQTHEGITEVALSGAHGGGLNASMQESIPQSYSFIRDLEGVDTQMTLTSTPRSDTRSASREGQGQGSPATAATLNLPTIIDDFLNNGSLLHE